jgi:CrcB protein
MILLLIATAGALGAVGRYLFSSFVLRVPGSLFPVGTFAVNLAGCLVFGLIIGAQHRFVLTPERNAFLLVGVLGGFTTFSSFAYESFPYDPPPALVLR